MADRGRKAFPISSHVCDERWQRHCMDLHKQRLAEMKHQVDTKQPETFDIQLSKGKRAMLEKERQFEIDRENAILLQKMVRIKEQDTRAVFRPWTARSTFQWKLGQYYDPTTGTKTLDHINLTSASSPRSIHYYSVTRPGTAPPDVAARLRDMQIQTDNTKLLRAITTMRSRYSVDDLERRHVEESVLVNRISNFRGPETARYQPPGRSSSTSRRSPYLAGQSPSRGGSRRSLPTGGSQASLQRYYEEAQSRDLPPAYSPRSTGGSRPGTAAVAPSQQGLGDTTPRSHGGSGSGKGSPLGSMYGSRPESASQRPPFGSAQGRSFSFDQRQREQEEQERQRQAREEAAAGSGDEYADEQYERDEQEEDARSARAEEEEEEEGARASASGSRQAEEEEEEGGDGYGDESFERDGDAGGQEEEQEEEQQQDEEEARASASLAYGEEEEEQAGGDEEEAADYGFQQDEEQGQEEEAGEQEDGSDGDAAGSPRGSAAGGDDDGAEAAGADGEEEQGQEDGYGDGYEQEEAVQDGAADEEGQAEEAGGDGDEGVAAGDDDRGVEASGEEDLGAYALPATTAADDNAADSAGQQSLKVGGFAADWD